MNTFASWYTISASKHIEYLMKDAFCVKIGMSRSIAVKHYMESAIYLTSCIIDITFTSNKIFIKEFHKFTIFKYFCVVLKQELICIMVST